MFFQIRSTRLVYWMLAAVLSVGFVACGGTQTEQTGGGGTAGSEGGGNLSGEIAIDGSSTVFPISEAMAEEFQNANSGVRITVNSSGTGGGFKKFCNGETVVSNASRPIKQEEVDLCKQKNIEFIELPVAFDALSLVVNPENDWAACLTVEELKKIWEPAAQGKVTNWKQVRPDFPDQKLSLYGPGTDSGTFDYFTDAIAGEEGASRGDYTASEDDNILVQGVSGDKGALGYFGLAYLEENQGKIKAIGVNDGDPANGDGCIEPSKATAEDGTYQPLARPIFVYVNVAEMERPEVKAFMEYHLSPETHPLVDEAGYIPLPEPVYQKASSRLAEKKTGSVFEGGSTVGVKLEEVL